MDYQIFQSVKNIQDSDWKLPSIKNPLLTKDFFTAMEENDCASENKGWIANHIQTKQFIIPAYLKSHSWGEYVFDQSWANTYHHYGYQYYPKLVAAIPFTPVTCEKIIGENHYHPAFATLSDVCERHNISSWHMLFCPRQQQLPENVFERVGVQFHWFNEDYSSFDTFLETFASRKRKNTRKERESIAAQNVSVKRILGSDVSNQQIDFFYLCYQITYLKRAHQPHLTKQFFQQIFAALPDQILLVIAEKEHEPVASALFFFDEENLYGRYWGNTEEIKNLHFELCYYQGIEFCIEKGIKTFNPGTQGEHKIQRGFKPVFVHSYHWLAEPAFRPAIESFCQQEKAHMKDYFAQCETYLPFKR